MYIGSSKKGKRRGRFLLLLLLLCPLVGGGIEAFAGYQKLNTSYQRSLTLAREGEDHLGRAEVLLTSLPHHPFDRATIASMQQEFTAASQSFITLNDQLRLMPGIATTVPVYGARLNTALHLVPVAISLSQAGIAGSEILRLLSLKLHDPLNGQGLTPADFSVIQSQFHQIFAAVKLALAESSQVSPNDLQFEPRLEKLFESFRKEIPLVRSWLDDSEQMLTVVPSLIGIGMPTHYLIEILDTTELRPAGGFIGNYGIATLSGGRLVDAHISDVNLLDQPFRSAGNIIPYPPEYHWFEQYMRVKGWSLRDTDLDADFPTSARYAEMSYRREGGSISVQGVIAITPALIEQVLKITGPIYLPTYNETVTADNLIDRIHYHQLSSASEGRDDIPASDGISSQRKHFTALLAEQLLVRVRQLSPSMFPTFVQLLINAVHTKDIQVYLNSDPAERVLQHLQIADTINPIAGDGLFVVNANIARNKANRYILSSLQDQVILDTQGGAVHFTTLSYAWVLPGPIYGDARYRDYVQVYLPPNSTVYIQKGWIPQGTRSAFGHKVWEGLFFLNYTQTQTITLVWRVPHVAKEDINGWHYQYSLQRQAGIQWKVQIQISLPSCAAIAHVWGGASVNASQLVTLSKVLEQDTSTGIDYTC